MVINAQSDFFFFICVNYFHYIERAIILFCIFKLKTTKLTKIILILIIFLLKIALVSLIILNILLGIIKIITFIYLAKLITFNITSYRQFIKKTISY